MSQTLRIHKIMNATVANGPGRRVCVWLQGCTLKCPGCFNPDTHGGQQAISAAPEDLIETLATLCADPKIEGITFSGGEPLQQWAGLRQVLAWVSQNTSWSVVIFTGYEADEIASFPWENELRGLADVVIAGRYRQDQRQANRLIGSANKKMLFYSSRYTEKDFERIPTAEIRISKDGMTTFTGINPMGMPA